MKTLEKYFHSWEEKKQCEKATNTTSKNLRENRKWSKGQLQNKRNNAERDNDCCCKKTGALWRHEQKDQEGRGQRQKVQSHSTGEIQLEVHKARTHEPRRATVISVGRSIDALPSGICTKEQIRPYLLPTGQRSSAPL